MCHLELVAEFDGDTFAVEFAGIARIVHARRAGEAPECFKFEFLVGVAYRERNGLIALHGHTASGRDISIEAIVVCDEISEFQVCERCELPLRECSTEISEKRNTYF